MGTPMAPTSDCNGKVYYTPPVKSHCSPGGVTSSQTIFHLTWNALECRSHNLVANSTLWPPHPDEISASKISNGDISLSRHPGGLRKATGNEPRWNYVTIALFFYCLSPVTEISPKRVSFESAPTLFFVGHPETEPDTKKFSKVVLKFFHCCYYLFVQTDICADDVFWLVRSAFQ